MSKLALSYNRVGFKTRILITSALLITLQSYYFYSVKIAPFPIIGVLLLFVFSEKRYFKRDLFFAFIFITFYLFSVIWAILFPLDFIYLNSVFGSLFTILSFLVFSDVFNGINVLDICYVLKYVLLVHLLFFTFQFSAYYLFHKIYDFLFPITGEHSRFFFGGFLTGYIRCTGLFNEPATYSYYIASITILLIRFTRKITLLTFWSVITIFLTLSITGFILGFLLLIYYFLINKRYKILIAILLTIILVIIFYLNRINTSILLYAIHRITNITSDSSFDIRFLYGLKFWVSKNLTFLLFGFGLGNYKSNISLAPSGLISILTSYGILGLVSIISLFYLFLNRKSRISDFIIVLVILASTMTLQTIYFWMIFSVLRIGYDE